MRLLLISNSTNAGEPYLSYPMPYIEAFLSGVREVAFVPYAAVTFSYAEYERRVQERFSALGIRVRSVHRAADAAAAIRRAEAVCVGGGNTFALARKMADASAVLLKNDDSLLPLEKKKEAVFIGTFAASTRYQGGGSSHVSSYRVSTVLDSARSFAGISYYPG